MNYHRTEHIAAGSYKAGKNTTCIYQAFLGTCLGVAIYDRRAQVGGLIHILLPEPPGYSATECPEKYAATGIPMLISDLIRLGAQKENMAATIAGGALVGPITHLDINLDIGGRSADIAEAILNSAGIRILESETGGFFTCTLELDMASGDARISPAWEEFDHPEVRFSPPRIDDITHTIETLNPIPQTALKIIRMIQADRSDMDTITAVLAKDQVLSARTLKICNSVLFSGAVKVDTLKDAVILLGQDMLLKSVITAAVDNYFNQFEVSGYSLCRGGLFFHAVGVAICAETIASMTGKVKPKQAYTAGLLHDIGKVVLDQFVSKAAPSFFRNLGIEGETALSSEKKVIGLNHCEAGSLLAKQWQLSSALNRVILHHHEPEKSPADTDMVSVVHLADLIMARFGNGLEMEKMDSDHIGFVMEKLSFDPARLPALIDTIPDIDQLKRL